jgi:hypothetical protein
MSGEEDGERKREKVEKVFAFLFASSSGTVKNIREILQAIKAIDHIIVTLFRVSSSPPFKPW